MRAQIPHSVLVLAVVFIRPLSDHGEDTQQICEHKRGYDTSICCHTRPGPTLRRLASGGAEHSMSNLGLFRANRSFLFLCNGDNYAATLFLALTPALPSSVPRLILQCAVRFICTWSMQCLPHYRSVLVLLGRELARSFFLSVLRTRYHNDPNGAECQQSYGEGQRLAARWRHHRMRGEVHWCPCWCHVYADDVDVSVVV